MRVSGVEEIRDRQAALTRQGECGSGQPFPFSGDRRRAEVAPRTPMQLRLADVITWESN